LLLSLRSKKRAAYLWFPHLPLTFIYLLWGIAGAAGEAGEAAADNISSCRHIWQPMKCKEPGWMHFRNLSCRCCTGSMDNGCVVCCQKLN